VLVSFSDLLVERRSQGAAAGAFTCYDLTTALGVVRAAEERHDPAILLVAEASFRAPAGRLLIPALLAVADAARVPMCVQLDHVTDNTLIDAALAAGIGAVMADGSRLPFAENSAFAAAVTRRSGAAGVGGRARPHRGRRGSRRRDRSRRADRSGRCRNPRRGDGLRLLRRIDRKRARLVRVAALARLAPA
jgi:hypothetical protein